MSSECLCEFAKLLVYRKAMQSEGLRLFEGSRDTSLRSERSCNPTVRQTI
jgi:hypothetical protein